MFQQAWHTYIYVHNTYMYVYCVRMPGPQVSCHINTPTVYMIKCPGGQRLTQLK